MFSGFWAPNSLIMDIVWFGGRYMISELVFSIKASYELQLFAPLIFVFLDR